MISSRVLNVLISAASQSVCDISFEHWFAQLLSSLQGAFWSSVIYLHKLKSSSLHRAKQSVSAEEGAWDWSGEFIRQCLSVWINTLLWIITLLPVSGYVKGLTWCTLFRNPQDLNSSQLQCWEFSAVSDIKPFNCPSSASLVCPEFFQIFQLRARAS